MNGLLAFGLGLGQQLVPVVRWVADLQHLAEHPIGVVAAAVGALAVLVIDPGEHDQLARCVVAE